MKYLLATSAVIEKDVSIGEGTFIWYFSHIREKAKIGKNCNIGDHCYIDKKVIIGDDCRIANNVNIYEGVIVKDKVYIGPNVTLTNVRKPLAYKKSKKFLDTIIEEEVSIEAGSVIQGGVKIGKGTIVGAGSIVINNIKPGVFAVGNPAVAIKKIEKINLNYGKEI